MEISNTNHSARTGENVARNTASIGLKPVHAAYLRPHGSVQDAEASLQQLVSVLRSTGTLKLAVVIEDASLGLPLTISGMSRRYPGVPWVTELAKTELKRESRAALEREFERNADEAYARIEEIWNARNSDPTLLTPGFYRTFYSGLQELRVQGLMENVRVRIERPPSIGWLSHLSEVAFRISSFYKLESGELDSALSLMANAARCSSTAFKTRDAALVDFLVPRGNFPNESLFILRGASHALTLREASQKRNLDIAINVAPDSEFHGARYQRLFQSSIPERFSPTLPELRRAILLELLCGSIATHLGVSMEGLPSDIYLKAEGASPQSLSDWTQAVQNGRYVANLKALGEFSLKLLDAG